MNGPEHQGSPVSPRARVLPWPGRSRRAKAAERKEAAVHDALHLLRNGLCAVCRERDESATRWLSYFIVENHTEEGTCARVQAAAGLCPAHTRRLLGDASASWLMPQVLDLALTGGTRILGEPGSRPARCPCCVAGGEAAQRALDTLLRAFGRQQVREALEGGAVCLPHTTLLTTRVPWTDGLHLAETASALLEAGGRETAWSAGMDADAPVRAALLDRLAPLVVEAEHQQRLSVTSRWKADVATDACPLCLAEHRETRRLLTWAATTTDRGHPAREESALCERHLHDLTAIGGPNVEAVLADNRDQRSARLLRFRRLLGEGRKGRADAGSHLLSVPRCRACAEERTAVRRQAALLSAQLHDPAHAREYEQTHGICLRHALEWRGGLPAPVHEVLTARLALLRWEIDEALRKQDWHTRHEHKGAEMSVGQRAPTLLDGRVYAGLPAPGEQADVRTEDVPKNPHLISRRP